MRNKYLLLLLLLPGSAFAQPYTLSVEKIMRDPKWIGSSPSSPRWSPDSKTIFFDWNPDRATSDSAYYIGITDRQPKKASVAEKQDFVNATELVYNLQRTAAVYSKNGDIYYLVLKGGQARRITNTVDIESNPRFSFGDTRIVYSRSQNLYAWDINTGETIQLTNIRTGDAPAATTGGGGGGFGRNAGGPPAARSGSGGGGNLQEDWLKKDQLQYFEVLRDRKRKADERAAYLKSTQPKELRSINIEDRIIQGLDISPDGRFVSYRLSRNPANAKTTIVPNYVTESGFTVDIPGRTKVGAASRTSELFIYDRQRDTVILLKADSIPGISDLPDYVKDYPRQLQEHSKRPALRAVTMLNPVWSPKGSQALIDIRSDDSKDRWIMLWDTASRQLKLLDRQRDEAWIGGPGGGAASWIDETTVWFRSEASGYAHLYLFNTITGEKKALTSGTYEVQQAQLSNDKKYFYITTNAVHPGEKQFYRLAIASGKQERLTWMEGANQVSLSPDENWLAFLYSAPTNPWELYLQENKAGSKPVRITDKARSEEFMSYPWRQPEVISFAARDGAMVYARLYRPANPHPSKPAVLFVHGAGYLQNAHKWWSSYFREYMFNNLLADNGYYVMDIDYRGSAGYGRDWRTGIYRHMGGKDLSDHTDAAAYLVKEYGVDPARIGLYGGSYGGFITLMGLFTEPDVFAAGAALRPVTDWANYNHGYTANILNEPYNDSLAYRRSSPIYFAEGLKGHLLMCHGMVDVNVHYQDVVKLSQRLIELGKDNWELASYPMEDHAFEEPSSWTDEYKRIFRLFETVLKK